MPTSDAVAREAAWLRDFDPDDGLPALVAPGGPWDDVHAYNTRTPPQYERVVYVTRARIVQPRFAAQRLMSTYQFRLRLWWPLLDETGEVEADQQALDDAVDLLQQRIAGPVPINGQVLDKTHGGRFLSVAENPRTVEVEFIPTEETIAAGNIQAVVTYAADDPEEVG